MKADQAIYGQVLGVSRTSVTLIQKKWISVVAQIRLVFPYLVAYT